MLKAIQTHIENIDSKSELAKLKLESLDVSKGLLKIRDTLLSLTIDKEVGAVLMYDGSTDDLAISKAFHGDDSSVAIDFPSSAKAGSKVVIGDVHTHPPTRHNKDTVYLAPSAQDMLATAKRLESTEAVHKYYMTAVVMTVHGAYVMMADGPPRQNLETLLTGKQIHSKMMKKVKEDSIELTTGQKPYDLSTSLVKQRFPGVKEDLLERNINVLHSDLITTYNDISTEKVPGFARLLYEVSLAQCVEMLSGTCIQLFYGDWKDLGKLNLVKNAPSEDIAFQNYVQGIKASQKQGQLKELMGVKPTDSKLVSSSWGVRCDTCLKVHQYTVSLWGKWYKCGKCRAVFCDQCSAKLKWTATSTFSSTGTCKYCDGEVAAISW